MAGDDSYLADLDAVSAPRVKVKLNDQDWWIPGDPDAELIVNMQVLGAQMQRAAENEDPDKMKDCLDESKELITDLFRVMNADQIPEPEYDEETGEEIDPGGLPISNRQINELLTKLTLHYQSQIAEAIAEQGGEAPPKGPSSKGNGSKPAPRRNAKRSSAKRSGRSRSSRSSTSSPT